MNFFNRVRVRLLVVGLSAVTAMVLVLASTPGASAAGAGLVSFSFTSSFRSSQQQQNFVIVAPAGTSTFLAIDEINISSMNLVFGFPDMSGFTAAYTVGSVAGACEPSPTFTGFVAPGQECSFELGVIMPAPGVYHTTFEFTVDDVNLAPLTTISKRVMLVSLP
jgi:hypothetical protein